MDEDYWQAQMRLSLVQDPVGMGLAQAQLWPLGLTTTNYATNQHKLLEMAQ